MGSGYMSRHRGAIDSGASTTTSGLKRSITGKQLFFYTLGDVLGSGIYVLIGLVAAAVGGAFWIAFALGVTVAAITGGRPTPNWSPSTPRLPVPRCTSTRPSATRR